MERNIAIPSNADVRGVQDQVRTAALESFEFFANRVLSCSLEEHLCECVQDVVVDREDYFFTTTHPESLAAAIQGWLTALGIAVLSTFEAPKLEILSWLELQGKESQTAASDAVSLEVSTHGVKIQWL